MIRRAAAAVLGAALATAAPARAAEEVSPLLAPTRDRALYEAAIEAERPSFDPPPGVTGITAPHHLLAPDLIARAFWAASAGDYDRVILISPDHFRAVKGAFATTERGFDTIFGPVETDAAAAAALLDETALFERLDDAALAGEHGLQALAPMIARFWPEAEVVPVLASIYARPADWAAADELLAPMLGPRTLVVQSTDYSHYLPIHQAALRDQESVSAIVARDPDAIAPMLQPAHMDSKAAQAIQMRLQARLGAAPVVVANRNQVEYGASAASTTSYVVTVWLRDPALGARLRYDDQAVAYIAGDMLPGRFLTPILMEEAALDAIAADLGPIVDGAPLIVNFEGVTLDETPAGLPPGAHLAPSRLAAPALHRLGATAASLANNHSYDLGPEGLEESRRILERLGVRPLVHGEAADFGAFRLLPLNFHRGAVGQPHVGADPRGVEMACEIDAAPPLVVFAHWGAEYVNAARESERGAAERLLDCGVTLIVGAHSHLASERIASLRGGAGQMVYSVGNFLFDQKGPRASGALLELRVFGQGVIASRLIPIPNYFELGAAARRRVLAGDGG